MISAEQSVIGAIILDSNKFLRAALLELSPDNFSDPDYRLIFKTACDIDNECKPCDIVTLEERLGDKYRDKLIKAAEALPSMSLEHFKEYARIIREKSQVSSAKDIISSLVLTPSDSADIEAYRDELSKALAMLNHPDMETTVNAKDGFLRFIEAKENPKEYFESGLARLDKSLKIGSGDYIVVGGRPSSGKTAFTLQLMLNMSAKRRALYFSLETSPEKIFDRLMTNYTGVPFADIKDGKRLAQTGAWEQITPFYDSFVRHDFGVVSAAGWTTSQIKAKAIQEKAEIVFIDYLGLIKGNGRSIYEKTTTISNDLHIMAQQTGIAVIALAQMNRQGESSPDMSSLRDSGAIEQDADAIIMLTKTEDKDPKRRELYITKNKEGELCVIHLYFNGSEQRFTELDLLRGQSAS